MSLRRAPIALAYAETRLAQAMLRTRADIERRQAQLWRRLTPALAKTPALAAHAGQALSAFPVTEPRDMRAQPEAWNSLGLSATDIEAAATAAEKGESGGVRDGVSAGFSTGSEGVRGVFLSSEAERARYLGQSLAKLLPGNVLRRRRIGLCLRANNALYREVANAGPFTFRYFSLATDAAERAHEIAVFAPDIFIAPGHVLVDLAQRGVALRLERLFYGAEPMGEVERAWIGQALGARPDPIYQATEGFLGAACAHGTLHLNEDSIVFELEPIANSNRHRLIVTDLRRTSQPMVRVRLDDLIQLDDTPCPCNSPLRAILPVEGRLNDVWQWDGVMLFPREIEAAIASAAPPPIDWRAVGAPQGVSLSIDAAHAPAARGALAALLASAGVRSAIETAPWVETGEPKRRRVRWSHG